MDKKRIVLAMIFAVVCVALGYLMYRIFFAKKTPPAQTTKTSQTQQTSKSGILPSAQEGQSSATKVGKLPSAQTISQTGAGKITTPTSRYPIKKLSDAPIIGAKIDTSGSAKFYNTIDGQFYRSDKNGQIQKLGDEVFYNVQKVTWSGTENESIIEYPDGSNIYYNFDTKKQISLPKHWQDFSFSPLGDKIAAKSMGLSEENRWLISADPQGKQISLIEPLGKNADKVTVDWSPNKQIVALSNTGEAMDADRQEIYFIGQHQENFKSIIVEGRGMESQWSPQGKKLVYSVYSARSNYLPELWMVNAEGENIGTGRKMLNLNTWSNKCAFKDERFLYCATPQKLNKGAGFAPGLADNTPDNLYKIDLETNIKSEINLDEEHVIKSMYVSPDGKTLYFTDKNQDGLFNIPL